MDNSEIRLRQERAGNIRVGDWLPNLGKVNRVLTNGSSVRFYFELAASREFEISAIVYRDANNDAARRRWVPLDTKPAARERPLAINGVSIE